MIDTRCFHSVVCLLLLIIGCGGQAAVPVEESVATGSQAGAAPAVSTAQPSTSQPSATPDRRLSELFYQLQVLQQEVQELRGLVEEQSYQLNRLSRDQKDQYIDLDRRIADVMSATGVVTRRAGQGIGTSPGGINTTVDARNPAGASSGVGTSAIAGSSIPVTPTASGIGAVAGMSERDSYTTAFDLMKARRFDESVNAFNELILNYPNGQYTPNAFYWLGELHLAQEDTELARQSFAQVVNLYPDHPKVPDTLYKLGVTYHRLGDNAQAMDYFNQVQANYPQSSAAGLAASYATEMR